MFDFVVIVEEEKLTVPPVPPWNHNQAHALSRHVLGFFDFEWRFVPTTATRTRHGKATCLS